MLKYILLVLSESCYETAKKRRGEIEEKVKPHQVELLLKRASDGLPEGEEIKQKALVITDEPESARRFLNGKWFVVILYHEKNRQMVFPAVRYGVEDIFSLEYQSFEETYRRLAGLPWDILETERLKIRESTLEDVKEFYRIYRDPSITLYMEDLYQREEDERAYMKAYIDQIYGFYGYGLWTVLLRGSGQVIGRAGFSIREGYELPELGFVIGTAHQRQGYGFEACRAALRYAREELEFDRVQALVKEKNLASIQLLAKLGFLFQKDVLEREGSYRLYTKFLE